MKITRPCVVSLTWRLEDTLGETIDELVEPMEFLVGGEDLLAKVEEALLGQTEGHEATLHLEPEHAFGDYNADLVCYEERALFDEAPEEGMQLDGLPEGAKTVGMPADAVYTVTEVYDTHVVLDANHPLAGIALVLALKVCGVREASEDEVSNGSVTPPVSVLESLPTPTQLH